MAVSDEIREQTNKLKDMNNKQKCEYIWTYYKWWILGTIGAIAFVISLVSAIIKNSKPIYLDVMFLNSTANEQGDLCTLDTDFLQEYNVDEGEYRASFDYTTYLDNNGGNQQSVAGQVKVVSKYQAEELDVICGPDEVLSDAADVGGYAKLEEVLPEGMLEELINKGYEPYYYTEKIYDDDAAPDSEGKLPFTYGEKYIGGIYINNSKKLFGEDSRYPYNTALEDKVVLAIAWNSPHLEHAIQFLDYVTK
ncbi:MAG: hypothetical protein ACI4CW_02155 [Lachnospiraceae bacterium]